jgi:hypothetical protein
LVTDPVPEHQPAPFSGRAAFTIAQSYYYVAAVVGIGLLLGGVIEALIGVRQLVLPASTSGVGGPYVETASTASRDAVRSVLGGLAFAIPGAVVFLWHIREARRREVRSVVGTFWGSALYSHLVALVALSIAVGGTISLLHSLRDAALPLCYPIPDLGVPPVSATPVPGLSPPVITISPSPEIVQAERRCYPPASEALRSAADSFIVASVAGATWAWHLRRGRRIDAAPPAGP